MWMLNMYNVHSDVDPDANPNPYTNTNPSLNPNPKSDHKPNPDHKHNIRRDDNCTCKATFYQRPTFNRTYQRLPKADVKCQMLSTLRYAEQLA